jgi:hypothetical protein
MECFSSRSRMRPQVVQTWVRAERNKKPVDPGDSLMGIPASHKVTLATLGEFYSVTTLIIVKSKEFGESCERCSSSGLKAQGLS